MSDQEIRFRISLDDSAIPAATARAETGFQRIGKAANDSSGAMLQFGKNGETTGRQLQALSYQTTDIVTSLVSGQSPFLVLLQQGGQLKDQFGGVGNVFKAVAGWATVAKVSSFGLAAGVATLAFAAYTGREETEKLTNSLILNGYVSGRTRDQINAMSVALANASGAPIGAAREAMAALAGTGAFVGENMTLAGRAVLSLQRLSGQSTDEIVKDFAGMRDGVAAWAAAHNKSHNYLTAAQYTYIRSLEAQGRIQEAINVNLGVLEKTAKDRVVPALGALEEAFKAVKVEASAFWDALKAQGRPDDLEKQIAQARSAVANALRRGDEPAQADPSSGRMRPGSADQLRNARMWLDALLKEQAGTEGAAKDKAEVAAKNEKEILEASRAFQTARFGLDSAAEAKKLAEQISANQAWTLLMDDWYTKQEISGLTFKEEMGRLARDRSDLEIEAAEAAVKGQQRLWNSAGSPQEQMASKAAILNAEAKVISEKAKRAQLDADLANGKFVPKPRSVLEAPQSSFALAEEAERQSLQSSWDTRLLGAHQNYRDLVLINNQLGIQLISDARARGLEEIAADEVIMRRKVDVAAMGAEERKAVEDELARWRTNREAKLNRELESGTAKRARELFGADQQRSFTDGFVDAGREGFRSWLVDGRSATDALTNYIKNKMFETFATKFLDRGLESLAGAAFGGVTKLFGLFHEGGVVGMGGGTRAADPSLFVGARRYHSGGLVDGEVPAILQRGEEVLRRDDPRHALNNNGAGSPAKVINLGGNTYNFGSGVTQSDVVRYVQQRDAAMEQRIRRLNQQGTL